VLGHAMRKEQRFSVVSGGLLEELCVLIPCQGTHLCHLSIALALGHYTLVGGISRYSTVHI